MKLPSIAELAAIGRAVVALVKLVRPVKPGPDISRIPPKKN